MKNLLQYILIGIVALLIVPQVHADSVNLSYVDTEYNQSGIYGIIFDDSANGFGLTYGIDLNSHIALDIGYTSLGSAEKNFGFITTEFDANLLTLALHHSQALGTISGHTVKWHSLLGVARANVDARVGGTTLSDNDMGLHGGLGLSVWLSPTAAITTMFKRSDLTFNNSGVNFDYDPTTFEIGYTQKF